MNLHCFFKKDANCVEQLTPSPLIGLTRSTSTKRLNNWCENEMDNMGVLKCGFKQVSGSRVSELVSLALFKILKIRQIWSSKSLGFLTCLSFQ